MFGTTFQSFPVWFSLPDVTIPTLVPSIISIQHFFPVVPNFLPFTVFKLSFILFPFQLFLFLVHSSVVFSSPSSFHISSVIPFQSFPVFFLLHHSNIHPFSLSVLILFPIHSVLVFSFPLCYRSKFYLSLFLTLFTFLDFFFLHRHRSKFRPFLHSVLIPSLIHSLFFFSFLGFKNFVSFLFRALFHSSFSSFFVHSLIHPFSDSVLFIYLFIFHSFFSSFFLFVTSPKFVCPVPVIPNSLPSSYQFSSILSFRFNSFSYSFFTFFFFSSLRHRSRFCSHDGVPCSQAAGHHVTVLALLLARCRLTRANCQLSSSC